MFGIRRRNDPLESLNHLVYLSKDSPDDGKNELYLEIAEAQLARLNEIAPRTLRFVRSSFPSHRWKLFVLSCERGSHRLSVEVVEQISCDFVAIARCSLKLLAIKDVYPPP